MNDTGPIEPMPLGQWAAANQIKDTMYYKGAAQSQLDGVAAMRYMFGVGLPRDAVHQSIRVVSTHHTKSIELPVYRFQRDELTIYLRGNFHDWKMSIESEKPINVDLRGLCHTSPPPDPAYTGDPLNPVYFEGFKGEWVHGYYDVSDKKRFSLELRDLTSVQIALFLILRAMGIVTPCVWAER